MPEAEDRPARDPAAAPPAHRRAHTSARDLERYAQLFATRTQVMRSSAMRDLMAGEEGPEVIEVNAVPGLTDTSLFPLAAEAAGLSFEQACERIVELALRRAEVPAR
jgi:2-aminoadipate transaminase